MAGPSAFLKSIQGTCSAQSRSTLRSSRIPDPRLVASPFGPLIINAPVETSQSPPYETIQGDIDRKVTGSFTVPEWCKGANPTHRGGVRLAATAIDCLLSTEELPTLMGLCGAPLR